MVGGFTLFFSKINLFQIVVHFIGGVYTSWFVAYGWQWESIWYIVGFTNITTALVEVMMLIAIFVIKVRATVEKTTAGFTSAGFTSRFNPTLPNLLIPPPKTPQIVVY